MEDRAIGFLNNIFNIQITSFSIILPLVFLFIQLSAKEHGTGRIIRSLADLRLILYFTISVCIILIAGLSGLLVGLPDDKIWPILLCYKKLSLEPALQTGLVGAFVLNLLLVAGFILKSVRHIDPRNYISDILRSFSRTDIETFVFRNQGLPYIHFPRVELDILFAEGEVVQTKSKMQTAEYLKEKRESEAQERRNRNYQARIDKDYQDILAPAANILNYNLSNTYIEDFNAALGSFLKGLPRLESKLDISVDPRLREKLLSEFLLRFRPLYAAAQRNSYPGFATTILEAFVDLAKGLLEARRFVEASIVIDNFEGLLDETTFDRRNVLFVFFRFFVEYSTELLKDNTEPESISNLFRAFSRVSEKVIDRFDLETLPLMMRSRSDTLFGWVNEAKYALFDKYIEFRANDYPLLVLDMNYCLFRAYTKKLSEKPSDDLKRFIEEQLYHFYDHPKRLCESAIEADNIKSACLCVMRYGELFNWLEENKQQYLISQGLVELIELGFLAVSSGKKLVAEFLGQGIPSAVLEYVSRYSRYAREIDSEIFDLYLRGQRPNYNHETMEDFLFELGTRLRSNFGLNFSWENRTWNAH